ncbi:HNH endonuclease [Corynebacterium gallinarum]|uniref:HNH endonuclease n=1 Tax=Corynebacterium gallinarum TaxID=2762214 RepID=A0A8I0LBX0_9CORY|nr:HNH endonuclease [Corynebacterium gallinarum]MBD8031352.1 HNH endonuclease [Corynebacterium gallinarum]
MELILLDPVSNHHTGAVEALIVFMTREEGKLAQVRFVLEPDEALNWSSGDISDTHLDGGGQVVEYHGRDAITALEDHRLVDAIVRRLTKMRSRRKRYRRNDWHNPWLWNLASQGKVSSSRESSSISQAENYAAEDVWRMQRQRTGQQRFRALLLESYPAECAVCGVDIVEVLEAAHLVPHSTVVDYHPDNGRLLCANHHRAFDAGLYEWTSEKFRWTGSGSEPFLGGRIHQVP